MATVTQQGPNVRKLIAHKMSTDAIPATGGIRDALAFLSDPKQIVQGARDATAWAEAAIYAVRMASEPNPWADASDEEIAGMILQEIEKKQRNRPNG